MADLSPFYNHFDESNEDLRTSLIQPGEIDTGVSNLLQSDYMSLNYDLVSFSVNNDAS